jgi:hypothetical protein
VACFSNRGLAAKTWRDLSRVRVLRGEETMITNESEIRIALQAVLVSVLALNGYWGCALMVLFILLPWKPIFAVVGYLAQPVVEWRMHKARDQQGNGLSQIEQELDALIRGSKVAPPAIAPSAAIKTAGPKKPFNSPPVRPVEPFKPNLAGGPGFQPLPATAQNLSATMSIVPVIRQHVRTLPQGVFHNMDLEVEEVKFHGETADAYVRFQSPNVTELVIRQRYALRKSGSQWLVESRQPANGGGRTVPSSLRPGSGPMRLT